MAAHRTERGFRVSELARLVGVSQGPISQIERGQSRPSVNTLFALAEALEAPVDAFFRAQPETQGARTTGRGRKTHACETARATGSRLPADCGRPRQAGNDRYRGGRALGAADAED